MFASSPQNNAYLELLSNTGLADVSTLRGFSNVRSIDVRLDVMILNTNTVASDSTLFGQESFWWFYFNPGAAATFSSLRFLTTRTTTNQATWGATLDYGKRYILHGFDDGTSVGIRVNGSASSATDDTALGTLNPIQVDTDPITVGHDAVFRTRMRLYEAWVRVNGVSVLHLRPKRGNGATVPDLTEFGNDMTIAGTENTDYLYGKAWNREPAFAGSFQ